MTTPPHWARRFSLGGVARSPGVGVLPSIPLPMLDCQLGYLERGSFQARGRTALYEIRPSDSGQDFRCHVWSDDGTLDKVAMSTDYGALWSAARELAWSWLAS